MNIKITPAKNAPLSFGWNFPFKLLIWKWVELHRSSLTNLGTRCYTEAVDSWTSYKKSHPGLTPSPCMESELDWGLDIHCKFALFKKVFLKNQISQQKFYYYLGEAFKALEASVLLRLKALDARLSSLKARFLKIEDEATWLHAYFLKKRFIYLCTTTKLRFVLPPFPSLLW